MARPSGTKNVMRTPEEKEKIVLEYLNTKCSQQTIAEKYEIMRRVLQQWIQKYEQYGIVGLKSKTGKHQNSNAGKYNRHPSEEEKLKQKITRLEIEVARLKKVIR